jgi:hypothetical protein
MERALILIPSNYQVVRKAIVGPGCRTVWRLAGDPAEWRTKWMNANACIMPIVVIGIGLVEWPALAGSGQSALEIKILVRIPF